MATRVNEVAAAIHADMVNDDDNGYSWSPRQGEDGKGKKTLTIDGQSYEYDRGSWDCASSSIKAWKEAVKHTKYRGTLDAATYTGNIKSVFLASGLFEWKPMSFIAEPGDLYLRHDYATGDGHVAMCQSQEPDLMSEFCINEFGGVYNGQVGDQTGKEAAINPFRDEFDGILHYNGKAEGTSSSATAKKSSNVQSGKKALNGIDIASYQADIDVSKVEADFIIVKVSGGTSYVNDRAHKAARDWKDIANEVLKAGKLLGLYHYACEYDSEPGGKAEAEFFLKQIKGFEGKAVLCLDFEAHAQSMPVSYAKAWLDTVASKTGATPMFYGYAAYLNSRNHSAISKYPLWMASYLNRYEWGQGYVDSPANTWDTGSWAKMTMYQYSSTRYISGYGGRLDVNVFYGTREDWNKLAGGGVPAPEPQPSKKPVKYRSSNDKNGKKWLSEYKDLQRDGYSGNKGKPMRWLAIGDVKRYRVCTEQSGWLPWVTGYDINDLDNGCAGDGSPINGVQIDDDSVRYAVHISRGWYSDMVGLSDTGGTGDNFAGDLANRIDAFRARRV